MANDDPISRQIAELETKITNSKDPAERQQLVDQTDRLKRQRAAQQSMAAEEADRQAMLKRTSRQSMTASGEAGEKQPEKTKKRQSGRSRDKGRKRGRGRGI